MHQQPRLPPQRTASPALAPASVPASTLSSHTHSHLPSHSRSSSIAGIMTPSRPRSTVPVVGSSGETNVKRTRGNSTFSDTTNTETQRLTMIMQNFFVKAASLIIHSRLKIQKFSQAAEGPRYSRWFNLQTREFDDFREELKTWKNCSVDNLPPTLIIETYLDTSRLSPQQTLVAIDDDGKRWNVVDSMRAASKDACVETTQTPPVVLERWIIKLNPGTWKEQPDPETSSTGASLPAVYKRCILFFRALFTHTNLGAVFNYCQKHHEGNSPLTPQIRITTTGPSEARKDPLRWGLCSSDETLMESTIDEVDLPIGFVSATWAARSECNLHIYDNAVVSGSHFIDMDDCFFQPSVPKPIDIRRGIDVSAREPPPDPQPHALASNPDSAPIQTYSSLNTFHGENAISTSPLTALKQVKVPGSEASSYSRSHSTTPAPDTTVPHSLPAYSSKFAGHSRLNLHEANSRRPSVSSPYSPFKAGSLAGSPRISDIEPPPSPSPQTNPNTSKRMSALAHARNKSAVGLSQLRNPTPSGPSSIESHGTGSPRPSSFSKYSSSFPHRRSTLSISGPQSRPPDEDQPSSAQHSLGSDTAAPVSALFAETGPNSFQNDEGDLSDFLKMLDSKKSLRRFEPSPKGESTTSRTMSQLSKYMNMRESNNALSESISASITISKPPSVRRTSGASAVTWASSSPGKQQSPHAPAIPSRLSENSLAEPDKSLASTIENRRLVTISRSSTPVSRDAQGGAGVGRADAIAIPISLRVRSYSRRPTASSVTAMVSGEDDEEEEEDLPFGDSSLGSGGVSLQPRNDDSSHSSSGLQAAGICGARIPSTDSSSVAKSPAPLAFGRQKFSGVSGIGSGFSQQASSLGRSSFLTGGPGRVSRGGENEMFAFELLDSPVGRMSLDEPTRPLAISEGASDEGAPVVSTRPLQKAPEKTSEQAEGSFEPHRSARRAW